MANIRRFQRGFEYAACLSASFMAWGMLMSFGTFLPHMLERYGESRSKSSIVHSVITGIAMLAGVFSGTLIKKVGIGCTSFIGAVCLSSGFIVSYFATGLTMLYATIGVLSGTGSSLTYVSAVVLTGRLFKDGHQTIFLSIQNAASGFGGIVLPYFLDVLVHVYGINGAFLVVGGILLNALVCALVFRHSNEKGKTSFKEEKCANIKGKRTVTIPLKCITFISLLVCTTLQMSNGFGMFAVIMDVLTFKRLSNSERLVCLVLYNISNTISRCLPIAINYSSHSPLFTLLIAIPFGFIGSLILLLSMSFPLIAFGTAAIGVSDGSTMSSLPIIVFKIVVTDSQPFAYGLLLTMIGGISIGVGPLYGGIYDTTDSYSPVLISSSSVYVVSFIFAVVCIITYKRLINRRKLTQANYKINESFEMPVK